MNPPFDGWQDHQDYLGWQGEGAPKVEIQGATLTQNDCLCDECLEYFYVREQRESWDAGCDTLDVAGACICGEVSPFRDLTEEEYALCREDWVREGVVSISNILLPQVIMKFAEDIKRYKYSTFWQASFWSSTLNNAFLIPRHPSNTKEIQVQLEEEWRLRSRKEYAYAFTRTSDRAPFMIKRLHSLLYEHTVELLQSSQLKRMLKNITGNDYDLSVYFYSRYSSGDL